ncbi:MAG: TolC family protein [Cyanobacteria bacterium]|nr:TolC family protein [Cyanobacteriota bacterium]
MKTVHHSILVSIGFLLTLGYSPVVQAAPGNTIKSSPELTPIAQLEPNSTTTPASPLLSAPIVAPANLRPTDLGNESVSKDTVIPSLKAFPIMDKATPLVPTAMPPEMPATVDIPVAVPAPDFLTTPANPLLFPTKPEEVQLKGVRALTLQETIELAERNNRDLAISHLQVQQQQAAVREAQASLYPTLDLQSNLNRSLSASGTLGIKAAQADAITQFGSEAAARSLSPQSFRRSIADESTFWDTSLQLNYDLYTSGARAARLRIAAGNLRAAELAMERVREQLRLDVTGEYYDLQEANEQVNINEQSVRNSEQSLRDANAQERAGLGTKFDVLRSEVQLANNQQQLTNSLANEEINRRKIAQRLSLPEFVTVSAADAVRPAGTWKLNLEETIVTAYKQRVELEEQLVQRDISEAGRTQALSALGPRIQLQARYNLLKIFEQPVSELSSGYSVAAVATWRLFDGGTARSQAQQQEVGKQIAETRFTQSRNNIRFQVEQSYATLISSGKNIETTTKALGQACEARRLAKLRFDAGVGTQTDVLNAETDLTRSAGSRVTAILNYNRSIAQLLRAVSNVAKGSTVSPVSTSARAVGNQKPDFCSTAYTEIR